MRKTTGTLKALRERVDHAAPELLRLYTHEETFPPKPPWVEWQPQWQGWQTRRVPSISDFSASQVSTNQSTHSGSTSTQSQTHQAGSQAHRQTPPQHTHPCDARLHTPSVQPSTSSSTVASSPRLRTP